MERVDTNLAASPEQRRDVGQALRREVSLESLADVGPDDDRADPVDLLVAQDASRLPALVPIRHGRMRVTPFTFYRGAAAVMASDLARTPVAGLWTQLCGDAHLSNFGVFRAPDRRLVFDVNDFDETLPGPFEWDLKRLVASVAIAGRNNEFDDHQIDKATRAAVKGYRKVVGDLADRSPMEVHYHRIEVDSVLAEADEVSKRALKQIDKAGRKDSLRALDKLTEVVDGQRRIVSRPPVVVPLGALLTDDHEARLRTFFDEYRASLPPHRAAVLERYRFVDMAHKVVGVGSVGTRCLIVLLESGDGAPLFLQFKEATASVLEAHLGASAQPEAGQRVVRGQRLMQAAGDVLLGWARHRDPDGHVDFYFRQLWDGKGSAEVEEMGPKRLRSHARICGATLALAHARTGDGAAIAGYLGDDATADHALAEFATRYADRNERDHAAHDGAIADGRIAVIDDV
jgi:uncharacterized protein (DUF2252 family)